MNIKEVREKFPQYSDLSDEQLADALHRKFYADMPVAEFRSSIGLQSQQQPEPSLLGRIGRGVVRGVRDPIDAGAQMLVRGANAIGLAPQSEVDRVDQINRDAEQGYQQSAWLG